MPIIHPINSDKERKAKMKYKIGDVVQCVDEELMFTRQVTLVPFYNKIDKTEYVEFNGKQYDKKKLEEVLAMIESAA